MLLLLAILVVLKFALLPLIAWQNIKIEEWSSKRGQLAKVNDIASSGASYLKELEILRQNITDAEGYFYLDDDAAKLAIQRDLEELFLREGLVVTGFNWVIDSPDAIRTLRATLFFKGSVKNMVTTFWNMAIWPKLIRIVEWSQQIKNDQSGKLGSTQGFVTLEFYALKPMITASVAETGSKDNSYAIGE